MELLEVTRTISLYFPSRAEADGFWVLDGEKPASTGTLATENILQERLEDLSQH